jgi:4-carboxymuconolactone decarboxylase
MTARHWTQQFQWYAHCQHALKAGLDPDIIDAIAEGRRPAALAEDEGIAYDFLTELFANQSVCDATYERTLAKFGEQGVIDLVTLVGFYTMLAMVMNVARTPVPDSTARPLHSFPC